MQGLKSLLPSIMLHSAICVSNEDTIKKKKMKEIEIH